VIYRILIFSFLIFSSVALTGQGTEGLLFYMSYDSCVAEDVSGQERDVLSEGTPECICGPEGNSVELNGMSERIAIQDTFNFFNLAFTMSFYFKPYRMDRRMLIMSRAESCGNTGLWIYYDGGTNTITVEMSESIGQRLFLSAELDDNRCWHHVVLERSGERHALHLYGEKVQEELTSGFLEFDNQAPIEIGRGACVPQFYAPFEGAIDELRIYDRTFPQFELRNFYELPNDILTQDTLIFVGEGFNPRVRAICATQFVWSPSAGVDNPALKEPFLSPDQSVTYRLQMRESFCEVIDTLRIFVVDPEEVTCEELLFPTAFTPNGDGINDRFFVSNFFVIDDLISLDIYDRLGERLFTTSSNTEPWDGTFRGKTVMPGVYIYKARWICDGEERTQTGSFSVLN
jgi:gliding motility-associated-like protein